MKKIYYNSNGWVCERYPYDLPIYDENLFIEVSDEDYAKTLCSSIFYAWRVVDGQLVNEEYTDLTEEQKIEKEEYLSEFKITELRAKRSPLLEAFDVWEKAVMRGREADSEEVMTWYQNILDLNEDAINNVPVAIDYYIDKTIR